MEFAVINENFEDEFVKKVNMYLSFGWRLHGSTIVNLSNSPNKYDVYIQPMIREVEVEWDGHISQWDNPTFFPIDHRFLQEETTGEKP